MAKHNVVRLLAGLSFLIFFCPFFQMCSDKKLIRKEEAADEVRFDTTAVEKISPETISRIDLETPEDKIIKEEKAEKKNGLGLNAYELASVNFRNIEKLTLSDILDSGFVFFSLYTLIILSSLMIFIGAIRKRIKTVFYLSATNLLLTISSLMLFICDPLFDEISQIKFGYYLFIINTLALIIFSRKLQSENAV